MNIGKTYKVASYSQTPVTLLHIIEQEEPNADGDIVGRAIFVDSSVPQFVCWGFKYNPLRPDRIECFHGRYYKSLPRAIAQENLCERNSCPLEN